MAGLRLVQRHAQGLVAKVEPGLGLRQARKQRGEMPIGSHAEQHDVERLWHGIDRALRLRETGTRPRPVAVQRMELSGAGLVAQQKIGRAARWERGWQEG